MKKVSWDLFARRPEHVVWKVIDQKGILLNLEDGAYFETNPVGLAIWKRCDGRTSLGKIADSVAQEFQADSDRARKDLDGFVQKLVQCNALELLERPSDEKGAVSSRKR